MVSRPDGYGNSFKSLSALMRVIGNNGNLLNKYANIVIVDDMESMVWIHYVPQEMIDTNVNIVCYAPLAFELVSKQIRESLPAVQLTRAQYIQAGDIRSKDWTFKAIIAELLHLPQKQRRVRLEWHNLRYLKI